MFRGQRITMNDRYSVFYFGIKEHPVQGNPQLELVRTGSVVARKKGLFVREKVGVLADDELCFPARGQVS